MPAFPQSVSANETGIYLATNANIGYTEEVVGVTKREYFAIKAMQGLMACDKRTDVPWQEFMEWSAEFAVYAADALLNELSKPLSHE